MASLVLGVVGAIVSPFIGVPPNVGFMVGSALGGALFPEPGADGPRLQDLKVQNSQYGSPIPIIYGTYRVAGNIIWSTDLIEHANEVDSGSGGGGATQYTYTVSCAVAICEGPILGITRIWADGKLVYNQLPDKPGNGVAFNAAGFKLYLGTEEQTPDATIEIDKGVGNVPAHRGIAYCVFTDLQLAKFGNVMPSLSFEVVTHGTSTTADGGDSDAGSPAIRPELIGVDVALRDISRRCNIPFSKVSTEGINDILRGYAITRNGSGRDGLDPLMRAFFFDAVETDGIIRFVKRGTPSALRIHVDELLNLENK